MARDGGRPIGEVLEELRSDFPDISVSKIRFLEAQGLINPQRTPAGYRQFTDEDLALLRWILLQQRDHYLPLKVIRRRLKEGDGPDAAEPVVTTGPVSGEDVALQPVEEAFAQLAPDEPDKPDERSWYMDEDAAEPEDDREPEPEPVALVGAPVPVSHDPADGGLWAGGSGGVYSRVEIALEAGLDEKALAELESFGLLRSGELDDEALTVARLAAGFFAYGVESRHLRMYKSFGEREAAFLEQVVAPMVNSRSDQGKERAREALSDLARMGQALRLSMLRSALGPTYGD